MTTNPRLGAPRRDDSDNVVRVSKCGRYRVTTHEYDLPIRSRVFRITDLTTGAIHEADTLADARSVLRDLVQPEETK